MHPIERLRYVARAWGGDPALLAEETAEALMAFADDPAQMVLACRRILDRHPTAGPLWWLCSRVLVATDPRHEAVVAVRLLRRDETPAVLERRLAAIAADPDGVGPVVVESPMIGPDAALVNPGTVAAATGARGAGAPVWLVGGVGRQVPAAVFDRACRRLQASTRFGDPDEALPLDAVDLVVGPTEPDFAPAPELLRG